MPIYEFECKSCGEVTEIMQKVSEPPLRKCPECGGKVHKLMSMNCFHLKGSGWYVTDYARKGSSNSNSGKAEKSETKSEDKPKDTSAKKAD